MDSAFQSAREALALNEVPIGCAFVFEDKVIARGRNEVNEHRNATLHAEIVAIRELENWCTLNGYDLEAVLPETELYVTAEPCIMCAAALRFCLPSQPKRIIYSAKNERFGGCGSVMNIHTDTAKCSPLMCATDTRADESIGLLKQFYTMENGNAPEWKRIKKK